MVRGCGGGQRIHGQEEQQEWVADSSCSQAHACHAVCISCVSRPVAHGPMSLPVPSTAACCPPSAECCIFHRRRQFGDWSDDDDSDQECGDCKCVQLAAPQPKCARHAPPSWASCTCNCTPAVPHVRMQPPQPHTAYPPFACVCEHTHTHTHTTPMLTAGHKTTRTATSTQGGKGEQAQGASCSSSQPHRSVHKRSRWSSRSPKKWSCSTNIAQTCHS